MLTPRQALRLPQNGAVDGVDPQRFGPACCQHWHGSPVHGSVIAAGLPRNVKMPRDV